MWWKDKLSIDGLYIHIPFCKNLCGYCDFIKQVPTPDMDKYAELVIQELQYLAHHCGLALHPKTLYFGGGTPSLSTGKIVADITHQLSSYFNIQQLQEFTVEANPVDISTDLLQQLKTIGVTRLSVGIQSPFSSMLFNLQRIQPQEAVIAARTLLSNSPFALNMDMIYGCPGMTLHHIEETIRQLMDFNVSHISAYELTLHSSHESSPYRPDDEVLVQHARLIHHHLTSAGFIQYEVSNYAKPGYESKHNTQYWNFKNVLGLGVGAHSSLNFTHAIENRFTNLNWTNPGTISTYNKTCDNSQHPMHRAHPQSIIDTEKLFLIAQLRKQEGFSLQTYQDCFKKPFLSQYTRSLESLTTHGWLLIHKSRCVPTPSGLFFLDSILSEMFDELGACALTPPVQTPI